MNDWSVTLKDLRKAGACVEGYNKVVSMLKGIEFDEDRETYIRFHHSEPISLLDILENNGLDDALWALRCINGKDRDIRLFAVHCARQVEHLTDDPRVKACNDVSEGFANGEATEAELNAAQDAAQAAAQAAAWGAAQAAAWGAAQDAAWGAAQAAAWGAACNAAWGAAYNAAWGAAWDAAQAAAQAAAWDAAQDAAWGAAQDAQEEMFVRMLNGNALWQETKP